MKQVEILRLIDAVDQYMRDTRGYLHMNPEISSQEIKTTAFLQAEVSKLGLPIEMVTKTGFVATLDTGKPGKTIAIRTDIDALPTQESPTNLTTTKKWVSQVDGASHLCGHDGHMAAQLGALKVLFEMREQLTGKIIFIFEEGEEIAAGIHDMVAFLADKKIDAIYGTHITSFMDTGTICLDAGPRMAGAALIEMTIKGRGGHGSRPDLSINPVFAAAQVLTNVTTAWTNQVDVSKTVTLGLTQIHAGTANNVIPETAFIGGTLRYFDVEEGAKAVEIIRHVATNVANAHNCTVEFAPNMGPKTIPVINDEDNALLAQQALEKLSPGMLVTGTDWYASEPFAQYSKIAPIVFAFVGTRSDKIGSGAEHHNERFDLDEDCLQNVVKSTVAFTIASLVGLDFIEE